MIAPTVEESFKQIRTRGIDVAREILSDRGIVFREALTAGDAQDISENEVDRFHAEHDIEASAAALLQTQKFIDQERARNYAAVLCEWGDDYFYSDENYEGALQTFQLAAALTPNDAKPIRGVITVCLQGENRRPQIALPYMVISGHLGAGNEVGYILKLIDEEESRYVNHVQPAHKTLAASGEPWFENAGANAERNGQARTVVEPPLELVWTAEPGAIVSAILISGSIVVAATKWPGEIHAFDLHSGKSLWKFSLEEMIAGTGAIDGSRLFAGQPGNAFCLDVNTGDLVWQNSAMRKDQGYGGMAMLGCVLTVAGNAIFASDGFAVYEAETGKILLQVQDVFEADSNTGACSDGKYCYLPGLSTIVRFDLQTREQKEVRIDSKLKSGPMIAGDKLVFGNNRSCVVAHSLPDLKEAWSFKMEDPAEDSMGFVESRPAFAGDRLIFAGTDGNVYALNAKNGTKIWKTRVGGAIQGSPVISGETVYVMAPNAFCALSLLNGEMLWTHPGPGWDTAASPALAEDYVVVGHQKLFAFKGRRRQEEGQVLSSSFQGEIKKPWWKVW